jgi:hypothetical protein
MRGFRLSEDDFMSMRAAPSPKVNGDIRSRAPDGQPLTGRKTRERMLDEEVRTAIKTKFLNIDSPGL